MLTARFSILKEIYWRAFALIIAIVPVLVSLWKFVLWAAEASPETQRNLNYFGLSRRTFWEVFISLILLSLVIVSIEGAYKVIRRRERLAEAMRALAMLIRKGHEIKDASANPDLRLPVEEIEAWTMEVKPLLQNLGGSYWDDYMIPFKRPEPIDVIETEGTIQTIIRSRLHYDQWKLLSRRIKRLEQFLADLSSR